ncbi:MAG: glycosyltransferase family 4 protein [Lentimicrobium sp.]|jgi:glycosyltransferase involved in cell wall biosynthesis|nr:glycosyltransferase family 4 protein [Lentimicrobium sp.]MDD2526841.1 glycosyltransferase family 4 protein [Lentimicrobiaceae bacterium]MDD4598091.1 glycosyltransferase family 4 protein [Lentimicrobiaceae bacterium]MDY0024454.1 glycosyltransferase family 4 protein [Lentimicrobium sp.]
MKVLMFGWEFPPHITGGLGTACFGMTKGLLKNKVEVLFVVPKAYGDESEEAVRLINASDVLIDIHSKENLEFWKNITYLEVNSSLVPYVGPEAFDNLVSQDIKEEYETNSSVFEAKYIFSGKYGENLLEEVARYALVGAQIAANSQFDVIHAHDWLTYAAGIAAKKASGKPLVVHMHATEFDRSGENINQRVYDIEREGMMAADRVIAVSNLTRNIVITKYGIPAEKVVAVHNAVEPVEKLDLVEYTSHVPEKIVTFLGRVTYQKGPEYFIEAAYKVLQRDNNVRFVMAGTGDLLEKMIRRVAQLRMSSKFHFTGFLKGDSVDRMFGMSDVYVMPSVSEPFGISPLEAMRSNVPVVISKQSGVAEILQHALKVDFWDIDAMADAIYALLRYKSLPAMFAKYGAKEVDNLKWENAARHIKKVYADVL